jgi:hypothetical protein
MDLARPDEDLRLEQFRSYLLLLACVRVERVVRSKVGASYMVQKTFPEAHRDRAHVCDRTVSDQAAWLRQIPGRNLASAVRDPRRNKRDVTRERPQQAALDESAARLDVWLAAGTLRS